MQVKREGRTDFRSVVGRKGMREVTGRWMEGETFECLRWPARTEKCHTRGLGK